MNNNILLTLLSRLLLLIYYCSSFIHILCCKSYYFIEINYDTDNDDNENDVDDRDDQKIEHENLDTIDILLSKCLIIATTDYDSGWNDFDSNINAHGENMKIIEILLQYGGDPNYRNCHVVRLFKTLGMIKLLFADKTKHKLSWLQALGKVTIRSDKYRTEGKTSKFSLILKCANVSEGVKILEYLLNIKEARMQEYIENATETKENNNDANNNETSSINPFALSLQYSSLY